MLNEALNATFPASDPIALWFDRLPTREPQSGNANLTTSIDISANTRFAMIELLNASLIDTIDLRTRTKHAHWNTRGPNFIALHKLYDELGDSLDEFIDEIGERVAALGGTATGTAAQVAKWSRLTTYPSGEAHESAHLAALAENYASMGARARSAIASAAEAGDQDTADLFTGLSRLLDKHLWLIEAHT
jgi:starvation-inducible DNA-binding protein